MELISDPATVGGLMHQSAQAFGVKGQRRLGLKYRDAEVPALADFVDAAREDKLGAIALTSAQ